MILKHQDNKEKLGKIVFKPYDMNQLKLPIELEIQIPDNHLVKVINSIIDRMDISNLLNRYKGGGTSAYHPLMMLKVIIYAYTQKIYTTRKIAKALRENIYFMWISAKSTPDFRTINNFRSSIMKELIDDVFSKVMELLVKEGFVNIDNYFIDGTKIEANANKYTFVWRKSMQKQKDKLQNKIHNLISQIEKENEKENKRYKDKDLEEYGADSNITSEKLDDLVKRIDEELRTKIEKDVKKNTADKEEKKKQKDKSKEKTTDRTKNKSKEKDEKEKEISKKEKKQIQKQKKILKMLKDDCLQRLRKYEEQEKILNGRNSYSKTDNDAVFMRMKEDHMLNGQLKPGYNVQIGTNNQFILNYSIHQKANDANVLKENLEKFNNIYGKMPKKAIADSGYGSEENYEYLKEKGIKNYVKYNYFHIEQKRSFKKKIYRQENMSYDKEKDEYICPEDKRLKYTKTIKRKTDAGYIQTLKLYECTECAECPKKAECTKSQYNRRIQINERLNELKAEARDNLLSSEGIKLRGQRCIEPESSFGQIKWNREFKRFLLRGMEKVNIEWGLIALAHNFCKLTAIFRAA